MVWLYKGAFSCSFELATEQQTLAFLTYPIKMLKMLQSYHIKPICIFDGLHLKAKEDTEKLRSINKKKNKEMGYQMAEDGQEDEARKYFGRSLVLRSRMIDLFIDILQVLDIEYLIAPYEADAQMSYMVKVGLADFAISEDSDLIVYGCPLVALKLGLNGYLKSFSY
jgi:exonuclease-1